ncbi:MAG TPA: hypothetical protein VIP07_12100 [Candidatus Limnocylindria bacterium]|jgi:hypothetical protein
MKLLTWSLATFHTTVFVLVIVLLAYSGGGLGQALGGLNTFAGLGLFLVLWTTTYLTTARALAGLDFIGSARDRRGYGRRAFRWGAANGMSFLAVLGIVALVVAVANTRPGQVGSGILLPFLFIAPIGLVVSAAVGGAVGVLFGIIDLALFAVAGLTGHDARPAA